MEYADLLEQCQQNDKKAQLQFYQIFYKKIYNCCFRILHNSQDAEDVMQEAFLKILSDLSHYDSLEIIERVLKRIAINKAIDVLRRKKVQFVELDDVFENHTDLPDEFEENEIDIGHIRQIVETLPEGYKMVINLHLFEEMDFQEIAQVMDISASTVRSQYSRAKQKLIYLLKKSHYEKEY